MYSQNNHIKKYFLSKEILWHLVQPSVRETNNFLSGEIVCHSVQPSVRERINHSRTL